jgi:hypothetical protein
LARALLAAPASHVEVGVVADAITRRLLQSQYAPRGTPCDQKVPACREAAARIAHDAAMQVVKDQQAERATVLAFVIDDEMKAADIAQAMRFAETPVGKSLAAALTQSDRPQTLRPELRARISEVLSSQSHAAESAKIFDRFYDETANLPRGTLPPAPPPPPPLRPAK